MSIGVIVYLFVASLVLAGFSLRKSCAVCSMGKSGGEHGTLRTGMFFCIGYFIIFMMIYGKLV